MQRKLFENKGNLLEFSLLLKKKNLKTKWFLEAKTTQSFFFINKIHFLRNLNAPEHLNYFKSIQ